MSQPDEARLFVINPNPLVSVQDAGRVGAMRYGVSQSGPMDWVRHAQALRLVKGEGAAIEYGLAGITIRARGALGIAVTGPGFRVHHPDGVFETPLTAPLVDAELTVEAGRTGMWGYLAAAGLDVGAPILGAFATNVRTGLGARDLGAGFAASPTHGAPFDTVRLYEDPRLGEDAILITKGPQHHLFTEAAQRALTGESFKLSSALDRMGYRLEGPPLEAQTHDIISDGIVEGAIQVPGNGQPIVLCADRQPTGGYLKIAVVCRASQPVLAQRRPGETVRFKLVSLDEAHRRRRAAHATLKAARERARVDVDGEVLADTNLISGVWSEGSAGEA